MGVSGLDLLAQDFQESQGCLTAADAERVKNCTRFRLRVHAAHTQNSASSCNRDFQGASGTRKRPRSDLLHHF